MWIREQSASEPLMRCRNVKDGVKTGVLSMFQDKSRGNLFTAWVASGIKVAWNLILALVWNVGTLHVMLRENPISETHEGGKYRCT